jgi:hypothetical protein
MRSTPAIDSKKTNRRRNEGANWRPGRLRRDTLLVRAATPESDMKLVLVAAAAVFAMPAAAQETVLSNTSPQTAPMPPAPPAAPTMAPSMPVVQPLADTTTATGDVPWCSTTITDHCKERSNARGERLHSTPRPRR